MTGAKVLNISREDFDLECLKRCIKWIQETYQGAVYLEQGEAIALNSGYLVAEVLDIVENHDCKIAILDTPTACICRM